MQWGLHRVGRWEGLVANLDLLQPLHTWYCECIDRSLWEAPRSRVRTGGSSGRWRSCGMHPKDRSSCASRRGSRREGDTQAWSSSRGTWHHSCQASTSRTWASLCRHVWATLHWSSLPLHSLMMQLCFWRTSRRLFCFPRSEILSCLNYLD